jgi:hypothetical protein
LAVAISAKSELPGSNGHWEPDGKGTYRSGELVLSLDAQSVRVTRNGETLISDTHPHLDHTPDGFAALLDRALRTEGLPGVAGDLAAQCEQIEGDYYAELDARLERRREEYERDLLSQQVALEEAREKVSDAERAVRAAAEQAPLGSFAERVSKTRVDIVDLALHGDLEPPLPIPGSSLLLEGVAHLWPMDRKGGKSIATLVTAVDIVLEGGKVVIMDRENGKRRYATRLRDILTARKLEDRADLLAEGLSYYAFPKLKPSDMREFEEEIGSASVVVFDSSRMFLSSLALEENSSDDYAKFFTPMIAPLNQRGIATLILDNAGWSDSGRPRGTSSKEDLNEQLFRAKKTEDFSRKKTGEILIEVKESRDGLDGTWSMRLGGGVYESWKKEESRTISGAGGKKTTEKAARVERMKELLAEDPDLTDQALAAELVISEKTVSRYRKEEIA